MSRPQISQVDKVTDGMAQIRVTVTEGTTTTGEVLGSETKEDKRFLIAEAKAASVRVHLHLSMTMIQEVNEANVQEWTKAAMHPRLEIDGAARHEETNNCTNQSAFCQKCFLPGCAFTRDTKW